MHKLCFNNFVYSRFWEQTQNTVLCLTFIHPTNSPCKEVLTVQMCLYVSCTNGLLWTLIKTSCTGCIFFTSLPQTMVLTITLPQVQIIFLPFIHLVDITHEVYLCASGLRGYSRNSTNFQNRTMLLHKPTIKNFV